MRLDVITIFPEYLDPLRHALLGKAIEDDIVEIGVHDLRTWATDRHRSVDDTPFGGGPGMVMKPEVWGAALDDVLAGINLAAPLVSAAPHRQQPRHDEVVGKQEIVVKPAAQSKPTLIVPTPAGKPFTQQQAQEWAKQEHLVFACGRYEGIDQRVMDDARRNFEVHEVSIGDYVLIGGEVAVLVIAEAVVRLIPGVLGNQKSHQEDSFSDGLLEGPSYTKPRVWRGLEVPAVLLSGNHQAIAQWRRAQSLLRTKAVRPELLERAELSQEDKKLLDRREVSTELHVLMTPAQWVKTLKKLAKKLRRCDYEVSDIHVETIDLTCEPDNMLISQYQQEHGSAPTVEEMYRVIINGHCHEDLPKLTNLVARALPPESYWYGTSYEGRTEPGTAAVCAWNDVAH